MIKWFFGGLCLLLVLLPAALFAQDVTPEAPPPGVTIHVVQRGETLYRIALQYGLTVEVVAQANGITNPDSIYVGQRLIIPVNGTTAPATDTPVTHTVQPGETLRSIADLYGLTVEVLAANNGIVNPNTVYVGQVLLISPPAVSAVPDTPPAEDAAAQSGPLLVHIVQPGETLFRIAQRYGVAVADLAAANGITDPTLIYAGQQLIIPGVEAPQIALDLPEPVSALDLTPMVLVEGQTGRLRITTSAPAALSGVFLGRVIPAAAEQYNTLHTMFLPVPIYTEANVYPLDLRVQVANGTAVTFTVNLQVIAGGYRSESLTLPPELSSLLDPAVEQNEIAILQRVVAPFTPERYFNGPMGLAAAAAVTSPYGTRRSYNGGPFDRYHNGTDFAGAAGTPVLAAANGRVVLADNLNIRGATTVIDHGWGIYTVYCHQSERYVNIGDFVSAGMQIGTIGATGRTTGAHLHWEVWVNGVAVDGMQWVRESFP